MFRKMGMEFRLDGGDLRIGVNDYPLRGVVSAKMFRGSSDARLATAVPATNFLREKGRIMDTPFLDSL